MNWDRNLPSHRDRGAVLPLVLVISVVLALVVVGLATYASTTLRYGQVVEASADRLTATDAGIDHVLQDLVRMSTGCEALGTSSGGYEHTYEEVNGIRPVVNCRVVGGTAAFIDSYALILTGANAQTGPLLTVTNGGGSPQAIKIFDGRLYMARKPSSTSLSFLANLTIKDGDLWYSDGANCPQDGEVTDLKNDPVVGPSLVRLTFTPVGRTTKCFIDDWVTLFASKRPPQPSVADLDSLADYPIRTGPLTTDVHGCTIWEPGRYSSPITFANGSYNYLRSGNYFFDNVGTVNVNQTYVLAGYPGVSGPSVVGTAPGDTANTNPCRFEWSSGDTSGASFYLGGNSRFEVTGNGSLEVSGRAQGKYFVGVQALDSDRAPYASTLTGDGTLMRAVSGSNKELSIQGTVWAPATGMAFDTLANDAVGAITGGAVLAELSAGAAANANNLLITVESQPGAASLLLTSTAVKDGTTITRVVADYRPTDGAVAVVSRRVIDITPE